MSESSLKKNLQLVREKILEAALKADRPLEEITLIVAAKYASLEEIQTLYDLGCRHFGENKVVDALKKKEKLPPDIHWHFIGRLQSNKVSKALGNFCLIHSVDSLDLARSISDKSLERGLHTPILLQVNISEEVSKQGFTEESCLHSFLQLCSLKGISIQGLMTMAPLTQDEKMIHSCFRRLRFLRDTLNERSQNSLALSHLSMGMSQDYLIAIQEGATYVRLGSALFK